MKKLLATLGSLGIVLSSTTSLVSCGAVPSSSIENRIDGKKVSKDDLSKYALPSMDNLDNVLLPTAIGILNVLNYGGEKVHDKNDQRYIGDAEKLSISSNINGNSNYYSGDGWDNFKKAYHEVGNSKFTYIDFLKPTTEVNDTNNAFKNIYATNISLDGDKITPLPEQKSLSDSINGFKEDGGLIKSIKNFDKKTIPYGHIIKPKFNLVQDAKSSKDITVLSEQDATSKGINVEVKAKVDDKSKDKKVNLEWSNNIYYVSEDVSSEMKIGFQAGNGDKFELDISGIHFYLLSELSIMTNGFESNSKDTKNIKALISLFPKQYSFTVDLNNDKVNAFKSLADSKDFKVEVKEIKNK